MKDEKFFGLMVKMAASVSAVAGVLVLAGCGGKSGEPAKAEAPVVFGPQYSAKKGLLVPKDTSDSLGLRTVEVAEQKIPATVDVQLRVYQANGSGCRATALVPLDKAKLLAVGQKVEVRSAASNSIAGKVLAVDDKMQKATGAAELLVEFPNPESALTVGQFLSGRITLEGTESVVTIPRTALLQCSDGYSVYTVSGEHLVRTPIKVGNANADFIEVKDGLYAGDKVVLQPVMSLWLTELAAVKGGQACCVEPAKKK